MSKDNRILNNSSAVSHQFPIISSPRIESVNSVIGSINSPASTNYVNGGNKFS